MKHFGQTISILSVLISGQFLLACGYAKTSAQETYKIANGLTSRNETEVDRGVVISRDSAPRTFPLLAVGASTNAPSCTVTAIGPRVLLTAAHCVFHGPNPKPAVTRITLGLTEKEISCQHMPSYRAYRTGSQGSEFDTSAQQDPSTDIALCRVDTRDVFGVYLSGAGVFERVDTSDENLQLDHLAIITGYGPVSETSRASTVQLSAGLVTVEQSSMRPRVPRAPDTWVYANCGVTDNRFCANHMLILTDGTERLARSDSGGAVFVVNGSAESLYTAKQLPRGRRIIAVNTAAHPDQDGKARYSYASALGNANFRDWASAWASSQSTPGTPLKICGLNSSDGDGECDDPHVQ